MNNGITLALIAGLPAAALAQPCGNSWTLHTGPGPSARSRHATSYDSGRGKVVLFGGIGASDTWEWTAAGPGGGGSWLLRATSGPPSLRDAGLVFDSARQRTVLFGGANSSGQATNQTWEWDGATWTQRQPPTSPPPMPYGLMVYHSSTQKTVLVSSAPASPGTWEYDGQTWTLRSIQTPAANYTYEYSIAFDAARLRPVLCGNAVLPNGYGVAVWELGPTEWLFRNIEVLPNETAGLSMTYDAVRERVLYVDSRAYSQTTTIWSFDGALNAWQTTSSNGPPLARHRRPVFDTAGGQLLIFGGEPTGGGFSDQTWLCRSDSRDGPTLSGFGDRSAWASLQGPTITFTVASTGTPPMTYQWRLNQIPVSDGTSFQGSTTHQLTITPEDYALGGQYDALVTDACGTSIRPVTQLTIGCYPNCDGTGGLGPEDWICYLTAYNNGASYANCDGVGGLTANDFVCFWRSYVNGCQ
jgi:hypothetical protein